MQLGQNKLNFKRSLGLKMMILSILTEQMQLNLFKIIPRIIMFSSFVLMLLSLTMLIQAGRVEIEVDQAAGFIYLQDVDWATLSTFH